MEKKYPNMDDNKSKTSDKPAYIPRYKSKLTVYLVICGLLYVAFNTFKAVINNNPLYAPWIKGLYFFASLMVMVFAYYRIARRGDNYIKQYHPDLYDRYYNVLVTGKKELKRPIFIGLQTMMNTDYENDVNLKTIRKEAKLYVCALAIIIILSIIEVL